MVSYLYLLLTRCMNDGNELLKQIEKKENDTIELPNAQTKKWTLLIKFAILLAIEG